MALEDVLKDMQRQISELQNIVTGLRKMEKPLITVPTYKYQVQDTVVSLGATAGQYYMMTSSAGWSSGAPQGLFLLIGRYYQATYAPGKVLFRYTNNGSTWVDVLTPMGNATHSMTVNDGERVIVQYFTNTADYCSISLWHLGEGANVQYGYAAGDGRWARRWIAVFLGNSI